MKEELIERYKKLGFQPEPITIKPCIRVNLLKTTAEKLATRLKAKNFELEKVPFLEDAFYVKSSKISLSSTQEYLQGFYYIQEAAAQLPALMLNPSGEVVLDCCAAPGGKTTQLAVNVSVVVALENQYGRLNPLLNNIERLGVKNCIVYNIDARTFEPNLKFKKILVDAPCSGNYALERGWLEKQSVANFEKNAEIQKEILAKAVKLLAEDGELVYSTCSLEPEEDEIIVNWAIKELDLKTVKIDCIGDDGLTKVFGKKLDNSIKNCRRLWPTKTGTQGFFIAKMIK